MIEHEQAHEFCRSIAERGYPHSGAIDAYEAEHVEDGPPEVWAVGEHRVEFDVEGLRVVCPSTCSHGGGSE